MAGIGGRLPVATDPSSFERQLHKLLQQVRVPEALSLLNTQFGSDDPKLEEQLSRFHALAGWALFSDLQFSKAFQHFLYTPHLNLARVLAFWKGYLPGSWDATGASQQGKPAFDDKAPEPCDIEDFVRKRLEEKQSDGGAPSSSATVSANHHMANAAMASFLLKQREALHAQECLPPTQRILGLSSIDTKELLRAVDTLIVKLLIEADTDDLELQEVLDAGVHCTIDDCETFLRERQRLDVLARLWKAQGMYDLVLAEWNRFLAGSLDGAAVSVRASGGARSTREKAITEMSDALRSAAGTQGGVDLVLKYVPALLAAESSSVMPIFTQAGQQALTVDEILQLLEAYPELVLTYLEHAVESRKTTEPRHRTKLALLYVTQLKAARNRGEVKSVAQCGTRQKLLRFIESTEDIDVHDILPMCDGLKLHDECVILHSITNNHLEALRVLVVRLDDLPRAERYCRILMARFNRLPGVSPSDISVLCSDPPDWAKGIAFGTRSQRVDAHDEDQEFAKTTVAMDESFAESGVGYPRPLMLFVKVLLEASVGAAEKLRDYLHPEKVYQEHAITLLTAYVGHRDLPPSEVIGMLPSSWTLSSLSVYLSRSARSCLHEKRATMLEENLSSMAYLKTFSTWAGERKRNVRMTGDKCCPVCNRRFVDKDAVGKAFVAYPNETCVHLPCKEKDHICPKTQRNFKDNASVYALGVDLIG
mmetsp:Transcript_105695/g.166894  ORF Transcript_105695/g.166894 Transcript_105695/m.166894 type:complete len:707 (+) Transcript_105695:41-2161(+)